MEKACCFAYGKLTSLFLQYGHAVVASAIPKPSQEIHIYVGTWVKVKLNNNNNYDIVLLLQ